MSPRTEASPTAPTCDDLAPIRIPSDQLTRDSTGVLQVEGANALELVREYGSPLYVISERTLRANYRRLHEGLAARWPGSFGILYAIKANNNLAIRAIMHDEGAGGDCFGEGELYATFAGGADPERVVLNGSNKTYRDLRTAVELGVRVNIDGEDEIGSLAEIASALGRTARVNLRLRVVPAAIAERSSDYIGAGVPSAVKILSGQWGFSIDHAAQLITRIQETAGLELEGFHHHIGRLMPDPAYYRSSAESLVDAVGKLHDRTGFSPRLLDIGGGLARERDPESRRLDLNPTPVERYLDEIVGRLVAGFESLGLPLPVLWLEPGRYIVGNAGVLLATVGEVKRDFGRTWVHVDASINNLMRADTVGSCYHVVPVQARDGQSAERVNVVGSLCTGGPLALGRDLPEQRRGDVVAFLDAGMYAETVSTQLNGVPRPATVLVDGDRAEVIKERETVRDVFARHRIPARLRPGAEEQQRLAQLLNTYPDDDDRSGADGARVAVFGTGRIGAEAVRALLASEHRLVGGIVHDPAKAGRDLGALTIGEPLGVATTDALDEVLGMPGLDAVLYCGMGGAVLQDVLERCADAGKDVISAAGLVHPVTDLGAERAQELDRRARAGGARILGAGMNPGFLLDALPVVLATSMPDPVSIFARRVSNISTWGPAVLRNELGFGSDAPDVEDEPQFIGFLRQSLNVVGDAIGLEFDAVEASPSPIRADRRIEFDGLVAEVGTVVGFYHAVVGRADGEDRVRLEWRGELKRGDEGTELRIDGPGGISETVRFDVPADAYPGTAARMVKSIAPLRALPPGLHTPAELAPVVQTQRVAP
jgi:diaminopimelate decarboxylase